MASRRAMIPAKHLFSGFKHAYRKPSPGTRTMATEAPLPGTQTTTLRESYIHSHLANSTVSAEPSILTDIIPTLQQQQQPSIPQQYQPPSNPFLTTTHCILHSFPSLTPLTLHPYPSTHLLVPMRKDLLHRAIIYEGDRTRQGTASTKTRYEVHGSNRKIRPQKGTGMARLGDKKSPMLRGGGVAFGPKPRSFKTGLPDKVYDVAWRIALSHRYRMGELLVLGEEAEVPESIAAGSRARWMSEMLRHNHMGHPDGRTLFVTRERREGLFGALEEYGRDGRALEVRDVDVKDLLELGRVVVEKEALEAMLRRHESDLKPGERLRAWQERNRIGDGVESDPAAAAAEFTVS